MVSVVPASTPSTLDTAQSQAKYKAWIKTPKATTQSYRNDLHNKRTPMKPPQTWLQDGVLYTILADGTTTEHRLHDSDSVLKTHASGSTPHNDTSTTGHKRPVQASRRHRSHHYAHTQSRAYAGPGVYIYAYPVPDHRKSSLVPEPLFVGQKRGIKADVQVQTPPTRPVSPATSDFIMSRAKRSCETFREAERQGARDKRQSQIANLKSSCRKSWGKVMGALRDVL